jgi:hypothetical protein
LRYRDPAGGLAIAIVREPQTGRTPQASWVGAAEGARRGRLDELALNHHEDVTPM